MELTPISGYFDDTYLDVLRSDGSWQIRKLKCQIKLADDFISIFNRPTRRRMLVLTPDQHSRLNGTVIRISGADEIYLIGNSQKDMGAGGVYRVTLPMNKTTDRVEIFRKCTKGTDDNPGALVRESMGFYYMDLELRTLTNEGETLSASIAKYFFWFQRDIDLLADDEFTFEDVTYRVLESFYDTGFRGARVTTEDDSREAIHYKRLSGDSVYDNETGEYSLSYNDYDISAEISEIMESRRDSGQLYEDVIYKVLVQDEHIGFRPSTKDKVVIDDYERNIDSIIRDRHNKSWELTCR